MSPRRPAAVAARRLPATRRGLMAAAARVGAATAVVLIAVGAVWPADSNETRQPEVDEIEPVGVTETDSVSDPSGSDAPSPETSVDLAERQPVADDPDDRPERPDRPDRRPSDEDPIDEDPTDDATDDDATDDTTDRDNTDRDTTDDEQRIDITDRRSADDDEETP